MPVESERDRKNYEERIARDLRNAAIRQEKDRKNYEERIARDERNAAIREAKDYRNAAIRQGKNPEEEVRKILASRGFIPGPNGPVFVGNNRQYDAGGMRPRLNDAGESLAPPRRRRSIGSNLPDITQPDESKYDDEDRQYKREKEIKEGRDVRARNLLPPDEITKKLAEFKQAWDKKGFWPINPEDPNAIITNSYAPKSPPLASNPYEEANPRILGPLGPLGKAGVPEPPEIVGEDELFSKNTRSQGQYMQDLLDAARWQYTRPYDPYKGLREAPINQYEKTANTLSQRTNTLDPFVKQSQERMALAQQSFPEQAQNYMNPYMQNVTDEIAKQGNRNLTENILPALKTKFVRLGQRNSSGRQDLTARAARDIGEGIAAQQRLAMHAGYGQAANTFGADQARRMQGAEHEATLGRLMNAARLGDISSLRESGSHARELAERKLRSAEQQHLNKQLYNMQRFNTYKSIAGALPNQPIMQPTVSPPSQPKSMHSGDWMRLGSRLGLNFLGMRTGGHVK